MCIHPDDRPRRTAARCQWNVVRTLVRTTQWVEARLFSLAAAKRELGLKAEGAGAAAVDDSEAGVGVAPAEGEGGEGGMDVEL